MPRSHLARVTLEGQSCIQRRPGGAGTEAGLPRRIPGQPGSASALRSLPLRASADPKVSPSWKSCRLLSAREAQGADPAILTTSRVLGSNGDTWSVPRALVQQESRPRTSVGEALGRGPGSGRRGLLWGAGPHWVYHSVGDVGNTLETTECLAAEDVLNETCSAHRLCGL